LAERVIYILSVVTISVMLFLSELPKYYADDGLPTSTPARLFSFNTSSSAAVIRLQLSAIWRSLVLIFYSIIVLVTSTLVDRRCWGEISMSVFGFIAVFVEMISGGWVSTIGFPFLCKLLPINCFQIAQVEDEVGIFIGAF